jgi:GTPase Era involved in 16S rRNA processing
VTELHYSIDEIVEELQNICSEAPQLDEIVEEKNILKTIHSRFSLGELHLAIIGQFNRGKSTFINQLLSIDLLPTSVLPLTAIPTEISFGDKNILEIETDNETLSFDSDNSIKQALLEFVTEENNPNNRKSVKRVALTTDSEILNHGTRIFDTPGFGSTHIHNTKATVDLLKDCDAALFLLSADLPITQMELNFIKQISPFVSRLFFIYNKVDLISQDELETTTKFIRETILEKLHISTEGKFYPVSAINAPLSRKDSGLVKIENEVIEFLNREKYFSLIEALQNKIRESSDRLQNIFSSRVSKIESEIEVVE